MLNKPILLCASAALLSASTAGAAPLTVARRTAVTADSDAGPFNPPWNDNPTTIRSWDAWCAFELQEGCYACANKAGAGKFCSAMCADMGCPGFEKLRFSSFGKCRTKDKLRFPITATTVSAIERDSGSVAVSPRIFGAGQLEGQSWAALGNALGPNRNRPTHPDSGNAADREQFWAEFAKVASFQVGRRKGIKAEHHLAVPAMFEGYTMHEAALAVEKDFPSKFPTQLVEQFLQEGVEFDSAVVPHLGNDDFVNKQVMLARVIGWAVSTVSPKAFGAKWYHGRARPEEVAHAINIGDSRVSAAPSAVVKSVKGLGLTHWLHGTDFTAYSNGAPNHPSWPAMHSAASSASVYLATVLNLTPAQLREAQKLDCAVASFRSFAGVHYESDNMAGLSIGQEVLRAELPDFLAENYGASRAAVTNKLESVIAAHDWREVKSCFYDGINF